MTTLHYSKYDVLVMFRIANSTLNPTDEQIVRFDQDLFDNNDETLVRVMGEEGVPTGKSVNSTVLLYSRFGAGGVSQRIRNACKFFKNTSGV